VNVRRKSMRKAKPDPVNAKQQAELGKYKTIFLLGNHSRY